MLETAVLVEVLPLIEAATSTVPELHAALERAWDALRQPASAGADFEARRLRQLEVEGERARKRLTTAAVLLTDGELDKTGYELLRDQAHGDLEAIEAEAERLRSVKVVPALPPLETVLAEAGGWAAAMSGGEVAAQREVVAALVDRVVPVRVGHGTYQVETTWTPLGDALWAVCAAASIADVSPVAA